ncbi:MAG: FixH family protein [Phycisphaerales bacterium]
MSLFPRLKVWPGIIFVLFGVNFLVVAVTVVGASRTASPIEPDYYTKALNWDQTQAQAQRNRSLGWSVTPSVHSGPEGRPRLFLTVLDGAGNPMRAATVKGRVPPSKEPLTFTHMKDGVYACDQALPAAASLSVAVTAGFDLFTAEFSAFERGVAR